MMPKLVWGCGFKTWPTVLLYLFAPVYAVYLICTVKIMNVWYVMKTCGVTSLNHSTDTSKSKFRKICAR